jgi:hypothetical protein
MTKTINLKGGFHFDIPGKLPDSLSTYMANTKGPNEITQESWKQWGIDKSEVTSITIPDTVTKIADGAFFNCQKLTAITLPPTVIVIEKNAFHSCFALTRITIQGPITKIPEGMFYDCRNLTDVTVPESVKSIDKWSFFGCTNLTTLRVPLSLTKIGNYAFESTRNLRGLEVQLPNLPDTILIRKDWKPQPRQRGLTAATLPIIDTMITTPISIQELSGEEYLLENWGLIDNLTTNLKGYIHTLYPDLGLVTEWNVMPQERDEVLPPITINELLIMIIRKEISLENPWLLAWNSQPGSKKKSNKKNSKGKKSKEKKSNKKNYRGKKHSKKKHSKKKNSKGKKVSKKK